MNYIYPLDSNKLVVYTGSEKTSILSQLNYLFYAHIFSNNDRMSTQHNVRVPLKLSCLALYWSCLVLGYNGVVLSWAILELSCFGFYWSCLAAVAVTSV